MTATTRSPLPFGIKLIVVVLIAKAALTIIGELLPFFVTADLPHFSAGSLSFLIPALLLPILISLALVRSPAAGFWAALAYAGLAAAVSGLLLLTPHLGVPVDAGVPANGSRSAAETTELIWRTISIGTSLLLAIALLRPSVFRWVNTREEELRMMRFPSRRTTTIATRAVWILPLLAGVTVPTLVWFAVQRIVGDVGIGLAIMDILAEHLKGRALMLDLFSMLPFAILSVTAYTNARRMSPATLWAVTLGGILGIVALMVPMYYLGWETMYNSVAGDEKTTGALIFFFTPLYCIPTMLAGMLLGWIVARLFRKGVEDLIEDHS